MRRGRVRPPIKIIKKEKAQHSDTLGTKRTVSDGGRNFTDVWGEKK